MSGDARVVYRSFSVLISLSVVPDHDENLGKEHYDDLQDEPDDLEDYHGHIEDPGGGERTMEADPESPNALS